MYLETKSATCNKNKRNHRLLCYTLHTSHMYITPLKRMQRHIHPNLGHSINAEKAENYGSIPHLLTSSSLIPALPSLFIATSACNDSQEGSLTFAHIHLQSGCRISFRAANWRPCDSVEAIGDMICARTMSNGVYDDSGPDGMHSQNRTCSLHLYTQVGSGTSIMTQQSIC